MFEPLSALVRLRREQLGLSLDALSALSRVSRTRLVALEKGDDNISLDLLVKVMNALCMTEIRIGGLHVKPAAPDFNVLVTAAEAIVTARRIVDGAAAAGRDLDRVSAPVTALLAPILPPMDLPDASDETEDGVVAEKRTTRRRA